MTTMHDTSGLAEQTPWGDESGTAPPRRTDAPWIVDLTDPSSPASLHGIVGGSVALRRMLRLVKTVATTDAAILIRGETGTEIGRAHV